MNCPRCEHCMDYLDSDHSTGLKVWTRVLYSCPSCGLRAVKMVRYNRDGSIVSEEWQDESWNRIFVLESGYYRFWLDKMREKYVEKDTDVVEMIDSILNGDGLGKAKMDP